MKQKKQDQVFILYSYDQFKNDYNYIKEYTSIKEIQKDNNKIFNLNSDRSIYHYIRKSFDQKNINLINNKYIIIKDII